MRTWRVGIDNYGLLPLGLSPLDTLRWAAANGADGVAFSGLPPGQQSELDVAHLKDLSQYARSHNLYLEWGGAEHIPRDMTTWGRKDLAAVNRRAAEAASTLGTRIVRSCSGGLMRWSADSPPTETLIEETAEALLPQRSMLRDHGVILAIETHFEFTSFELVRLFERCEAAPGDWLGICLDTMNLLTMIEEPAAAARRLLPWVVSTHIKDGGARVDEQGLTTFTAPIGDGVIDLSGILALLDTLAVDVTLSIEDHGGSFQVPIFDPLFLTRFPDLTAGELARVVEIAGRSAAAAACRPLDRADWPRVCEERLARDIVRLRAIAQPVQP